MRRIETQTYKCEVTQLAAAQVAVGKALATPAEQMAGAGHYKRVCVAKLEKLGANMECQIVVDPENAPRVGDVYDVIVQFVRAVDE